MLPWRGARKQVGLGTVSLVLLFNSTMQCFQPRRAYARFATRQRQTGADSLLTTTTIRVAFEVCYATIATAAF